VFSEVEFADDADINRQPVYNAAIATENHLRFVTDAILHANV